MPKSAVTKVPKSTGPRPSTKHLGTPRKPASVKTSTTGPKAAVKAGSGSGRMPGKSGAMARSTRANAC